MCFLFSILCDIGTAVKEEFPQYAQRMQNEANNIASESHAGDKQSDGNSSKSYLINFNLHVIFN